jgi:hypothetical protein
MKRKILEDTTINRRVYHILHDVDDDPYPECTWNCSMKDHCAKYKHIDCRRHRVRERNWKSQRKNQWKIK